MVSGYWQVEVEDREKKQHFVPLMVYLNFKVLPFGLCNGSATFQTNGPGAGWPLDVTLPGIRG